MSQISFDNFALAASNTSLDDTEIAGRYGFQALAERRILPDIQHKLDLQPTDRLLEIGCGPGNLLIPLASFVATAVGIDTGPSIQRLRERAPLAQNLSGISANFLEMDIGNLSGDQRFDKVLIYSVLHYLASSEEVVRFIDRALSITAPGGRLLLGDLTNRDRKARFGNSIAGQEVRQEWDTQVRQAGGHAFDQLATDPNLVVIDDALILQILGHIRRQGHESYLLPQPTNLPFGGSREDILIVTRR